ncbi:DNA primase RepB-like protein [Ancylobacter aquaticus]|uniref:DNA primase RepB-like protein n=2 Tax=Ancylobacter aquaticus TaxID=100 RepID=A0A4R1HM20_ANCAQ|nr:DNA primase RepB-like protein [Ancylobacter aquaticus]
MDKLFDKAALHAASVKAADFLRHFCAGNDIHCVAIGPDWDINPKTFNQDQHDHLVEWINSHQNRCNIYFQVNRLKQGIRNRKAKKSDIEAARALHVDVDDTNALGRILNFPIKPTVIVHSGGGFQAFWLLREPVSDLAAVEDINRLIAEQLGGDHCHNIDRIMRVPWTINVPNAKKRGMGRVPVMAKIVATEWELRYGLEDLAALLNIAAAPLTVIHQAATIGHIVPMSLADLHADLTEHLRTLILTGDDAERPRGSAKARYPSRSEAVFYVSCGMARAGYSAETIAGILSNPGYGISQSILEKRSPQTYALKQALAGLAAVNDGWPDADKAGRPRATMRNAMVAIRRLDLQCQFDAFRQRKTLMGHVLEEHQGEISDDAVSVIRNLVIDRFDFDPRADHVRDAITGLCLENTFHPIREMLDALSWDGKDRLDTWMNRYLGAPDTPLNTAVGRILLVAAVRRIRQPGVKFDQIIVLEGRQGSGKSTSIRILAGEGNHSDQEILSLDAKAQIELLDGVWFYELGEVEGMNKAEVNKIKAFASRQIDKARMAYGYFAVIRPRQAVFIGTTNEDKYLRDQTGNRRFWPVKTGEIDLVALHEDRDQLLAEAAYRERQGESIELPSDLWEAAAVEQEARLEEDPWLPMLEGLNGVAAGEEARLYTDDLLSTNLGIQRDRQTQAHTKRLSLLLQNLGWKRDKFKVGGRTVRGFSRPKRTDHADDKRLAI